MALVGIHFLAFINVQEGCILRLCTINQGKLTAFQINMTQTQTLYGALVQLGYRHAKPSILALNYHEIVNLWPKAITYLCTY